ncbi:carbohydrate kinase, PfkB, partial [Pseudomonas syringae pv. japonica str. M301072]
MSWPLRAAMACAPFYLGRHGQGRFGDIARQAMRDEGVEISTMPVPGEDTGLAVALVEASAERSFISYVGA